jgi:hypothetical protein
MTVDHDTDHSSTPAGERMIAELRQAHASLRADLVVLERALGMLSDVTGNHGAVAEMIDGLTVANFA